ncbi:putative 1-phosphatidylinositol-3-phosphate 5-kinase FAB1C [Quercus robur]|uniref:putative 1-phosphatidylinositol-3-phosphate 5-kinase FAB1C n=1 Tax=Quercus robur TaxID=38942 RepID=UPI002163DDBB|nr:putative 1-phosphatidylinositol-3-phosphate 5-kinase FAB1C [Quercus robur]
MGIPDRSLINLIVKFRSWFSWVASDSKGFEMLTSDSKMGCCCCECNMKLSQNSYSCRSCGRSVCGKCIRGGYELPVVELGSGGSMSIKRCKLCTGKGAEDVITGRKGGGSSKKVHPAVSPLESPRESPEPPSPPPPCFCSSGEGIRSESIRSDQLAHYLETREYGYSPNAMISRRSMMMLSSFSGHPSPESVRRSPYRSDEDEAEDSGKLFFSPSIEYCHDNSDIDSSSLRARHEFYSCRSVGSSPSDSPSRINFTSNRVGNSVQQGQEGSPYSQNAGPFDQPILAILRGSEDPDNNDDCSDDLAIFRNQNEKSQRPLDFENNGLIWFPPQPGDENDEAESNFFSYDDDDDDIGDSGAMFSSSSSLVSVFPAKEKQNEGNKEPLRAVVHGHFRALVSQLLQGEGIKVGKENDVEDWLDIVTTLAWQAANFVKPDTSRGGSMDPVDYVKVKCAASGSPSESTLIKGVVCTKNIKHKRMTSQYKNPRLLLLGGALEYQKVPNELASFDTLLQQEKDHLKMIISKIETLRPNVLLVEKSVSSYAQEQLLAREISLVLNVKRPLLERIAQCTGAIITPSIDKISTARLGHCELFRLVRVSEEHETANQFNKKPSKTLMFFEGCPRRLGCTVLLKGTCRDELKKVKHVVQYAVFAAYHLSLETSFLADEGASLPKMTLKHSISVPERTTTPDLAISVVPNCLASTSCPAWTDISLQDEEIAGLNPEIEGLELLGRHLDPVHPTGSMNCRVGNAPTDACYDDLASCVGLESCTLNQCEDFKGPRVFPSVMRNLSQQEPQESMAQDETLAGEMNGSTRSERADENEVSSEYFSAAETHQSILVSFSSHCVLKGIVCERSRLLRIKFYGCFDKPLGRYLRDDLFDQACCCRSCKEPVEAHVLCFTHQQGNLTINVRCLPDIILPGERDGKIWMWHRCLRCAHVDGVPPATRRVVMSDAAWGLSFGKFLELSFSNHATANRVAPCGHSLQRDCLRYYGFGSMVAFFRYSPIDILSVHLPPSVLEFNGHVQHEWTKKEAAELVHKMETLYAEISDVLDSLEEKCKSFGNECSDTNDLQGHIMELKDLLKKERNDYNGLLQPAIMETSQPDWLAGDILELNRLRRSLLVGSHVWDQRLCSLDSLLKKSSISKAAQGDASYAQLKELKSELSHKDGMLGTGYEDSDSSKLHEPPGNNLQSEQVQPNIPPFEPSVAVDLMLTTRHHHVRVEEKHSDGEVSVNKTLSESLSPNESTLSERIDLAWTGTNQPAMKAQPHSSHADKLQAGSVRQISQNDNPPIRRLMSPVRVYSFDSALRAQERIRKGLPPSSLHLSALRSFHASGDYRSMVRDPVSNVMRTYSQMLPWETQKLNLTGGSTPSFISSASHMAEGARLLLTQNGHNDLVIAVYENEPTSIISYALSSKEYNDWVADKLNEHEGSWSPHESSKEDSAVSTFSAWQLEFDYIHYGSYGSEDASSSMGTFFKDPKRPPHLTISFEDEFSTGGGKVKFSVTCYFAKQFDSLRKKCCPSEVDFVRSLSRCQTWSAQGGKSNVYFAKSLDERFIIKQVTKTELDSFADFAPQYFKYLTESLSSRSPTCLAKILGIYQVSVKHLKGGKETKMDLMVMENLFFKRNISRVYDLKGSARARYNSDTTGTNKVLLDMNLLETLRTKPIFLGSKAKRSLERAVWNDTSFLASVDVMDYSLLVGVDDERKELVLGIIDFMRQYTWDKHLETWVKASGILGGPKNASPTIISPKQYKKRFRKAMTTYFLTVPDQWSS